MSDRTQSSSPSPPTSPYPSAPVPLPVRKRSSSSNASSSSSAASTSPPISPRQLPWFNTFGRLPTPPLASTIDVSTLPFHIHHPLPRVADAIRLVRIYPMDPERPGLPVCTLETHFLDMLPPFCALSYSWGMPEEIEDLVEDDEQFAEWTTKYERQFGVVIDGQMFRTRLNLLEFLMNMAKQLADPSFVGYDLFWIDALCIDQENLMERNEHVKMMGEIYQVADRVLVWLGEDNREEMSDVKDMIAKVLSLGRMLKKEGERLAQPPYLVWERYLDQRQALADMGLPGFDNKLWWRFCAFFRRSWFYRLWILQEVAVAKQIVMLCGDTEFEIMDIDDCAYVLRYGLDLQLGEKWMSVGRRGFAPVARMVLTVCQIMRWCQMKEIPYPGKGSEWMRLVTNGTTNMKEAPAIWSMLLDIVDGTKFSVPSDNVYALVGIARYLAPEDKLPIRVDYSKSALEVSLELVSYIIKRQQWLNVLCRVQHQKDQIRFPSWVLALRKYAGHSISLHNSFNATLSVLDGAMAPDLPEVKFLDRYKLLVSGKRVGTVSKVSIDLFAKDDTTTGHAADVVVDCDYIYQATGETLPRALWKTLTGWPGENGEDEEADRIEKGFHNEWLYNHTAEMVVSVRDEYPCPDGTPIEEHLREFLDKRFPHFKLVPKEFGFPTIDEVLQEAYSWNVIKGFKKNGEVPDDEVPAKAEEGDDIVSENSTEPETTSRTARIAELFQQCQEYRLHAGKLATHRKLFRTGNGYLGIASEAMQVDDEVWLLPRTTVPIILRPMWIDDGDSGSEGRDEHGSQVMDDEAEAGGNVGDEERKVLKRCYTVLGESYVHGVMYGELLKKWDAEAEVTGQKWCWKEIILI